MVFLGFPKIRELLEQKKKPTKPNPKLKKQTIINVILLSSALQA